MNTNIQVDFQICISVPLIVNIWRIWWYDGVDLHIASTFSGIVGLIAEEVTQPAITCSKLTIETLEQGVKYVKS